MLSHRERKKRGMMEEETARARQRDKKRAWQKKKERNKGEGAKEGRKEGTPSSSADTAIQKMEKKWKRAHMPAHVSSETPLPRLDRSTNYRHPLLLLPLHAFSTSSHQGADVEKSCTKQMFLHLMLRTHPHANNSCSPDQPDERHYKRTHIGKHVSVT